LLNLKIVLQHYRFILRDIDGIPRFKGTSQVLYETKLVYESIFAKELGSQLYPRILPPAVAIPLKSVEFIAQRKGLDTPCLYLNNRSYDTYFFAPPGFIVVG
jgi:hypothetical protein